MENQKKYSSVQEIVAFLAEKFPKCFFVEGECKPIKIGLFNELAEKVVADEPSISKTQLRGAVRFYTTRWNYLSSVVVGAKRVDLDGNEGEEVTAEHAEFAAKELAESKAKFEAKKEELKAAKLAERKAKLEESKANGEERPRKPFKKNFRKDGAKFNKNNNGFKKNFRSEKSVEAASQVAFEKLEANEVVTGKAVHVSLGSGVVPATVREVNKDLVTVELAMGMVVKVSVDHIGK